MGGKSSKWLARVDLSRPVEKEITERIFDQFDVNKDGYLTGKEVDKFLNAWCEHHGIKKSERAEVKRKIVENFDKDNNNALSKAELMGISRQPPADTPRKYIPSLLTPLQQMKATYDVVVIGTGYGGAIAALRCAKAGLSVCVLERGREFLPGDFPETMLGTLSELRMRENGGYSMGTNKVGLYSVESFIEPENDSWMTVLQGNGVGGTSLINGGVISPPDPRVFESDVWPSEMVSGPDPLSKYYPIVKETLGANPLPPEDKMTKLTALEELGDVLKAQHEQKAKISFSRSDIAVSFSDRIHQESHLSQPACTLCGNCSTGCNVGAKNTTNMNYLATAKAYGASIFAESEVSHVAPATEGGWLVTFSNDRFRSDMIHPDFTHLEPQKMWVRAKYVFCAASSLGSTEILMRSQQFGHLALSPTLGKRWSANANDISLGYGSDQTKGLVSFGTKTKHVTKKPRAERPGPTITGVLNVDAEDLQSSFVVEDCAIPSALKFPVSAYAGTDECLIYLISGHAKAAEGDVVREYGEMSLYENHHLRLLWPHVSKLTGFLERNEMIKSAFAQKFAGTYALNPSVVGLPGLDETKGAIAVHSLGGCALGENSSKGVVNQYGQVFKYNEGDLSRLYEGLFVVDGSIVPSSIGKNPVMAISALAERALAKFIGGLKLEKKEEEVVPAKIIDETPNRACGVYFTETMHGVFDQRTKSRIAFVLTLIFEDSEALLRDGDMVHSGYGLAVCEDLSLNPFRCINVAVRLFVPRERATEHHVTTYDFDMVSVNGREFHFHGEKKLGRESTSTLFSPWTDSTTLFVTITQPDGRVVMDGIQISLTVSDFMKQLSSMRPIIPPNKSASDGLKALSTVSGLFARILLTDYVIEQRVGNSFLPPPSRKIDLPPPEHHLIDVHEIVLPAKRYKSSKSSSSSGIKKGPVILAHGLSMSGDSFCDATQPWSLAEDLVAAGYDVWLPEFRISSNLPRASQVFSDFNLDTTAKDWPFILTYINKITGQKPHVFAHCSSSLSFWMSALSSPITRSLVRSVISSAVSFVPTFGSFADLRGKSHLMDLLKCFSVEGLRAGDSWNPIERAGLAAVAAVVAQGTCGDTVCHALTFMYGPLFKHSQLTEEYHDSLGSKFGYTTISIASHVDKIGTASTLVNAVGENIYVTEGTLQAYVDAQIPTLFVSGSDNEFWNPNGLFLAAERLNKLKPNSATTLLFPGYSHLDILVGKTSHEDVAPTLLHFFETMCVADIKIEKRVMPVPSAVISTSEEKGATTTATTTTATTAATTTTATKTTTTTTTATAPTSTATTNHVSIKINKTHADEKSPTQLEGKVEQAKSDAKRLIEGVTLEAEKRSNELLDKINESLKEITSLSIEEIDLLKTSKNRYNYNDDPNKICTYCVEIHTGPSSPGFLNAEVPQVIYMQFELKNGNRLPLRRICNTDLQANERYWDNFHPAPGDTSIDRFIVQERDLKLDELDSVTLFSHDPNFPRPKKTSFRDWNFQKLVLRSWRRPCTWTADGSRGRGTYTWNLNLTPRNYADQSVQQPSWFAPGPPGMPEGTAMGPSVSIVAATETEWQLVVLMVFESDSSSLAKVFKVEGKEISPIYEEEWLGRVLKYYPMNVSLQTTSTTVNYSTPDDRTFALQVPALKEAPRMIYLSCNGHWQMHRVPESTTEQQEPQDMFLWKHLNSIHENKPINLLIQNGDQIYSDQMWGCAPIQDWVRMKRTPNDKGENTKVSLPFTPMMKLAIESFFFDRYCRTFSRRYNMEANATIPSFSMYDDHDIMDGWGSMDEILQAAPVMQGIFGVARRSFLSLCKLLPQESPQFATWRNMHKISIFSPYERVHYYRAQSKRTYLTDTPRDSLASWLKLGPLLLVNLDLRSERTPTQVISEETWQNLDNFYQKMATEHKYCIEHVIVISTIPLSWPQESIGRLASAGAKALRMIHIESIMSSAEANRVVREDGTKVWAPLPVDDDMLDYWDHPAHAHERIRLMEQSFDVAKLLRARVTVLAGDSHMAGRAVYYDKEEKQSNLLVVNQVVSSGVTALSTIGKRENTIVGELTVTSANIKGKNYKELRLANIPLPGVNDLCLAARNICLVEHDAKLGSLIFRIQAQRGDHTESHNVVVAKAGRLEDSAFEIAEN